MTSITNEIQIPALSPTVLLGAGTKSIHLLWVTPVLGADGSRWMRHQSCLWRAHFPLKETVTAQWTQDISESDKQWTRGMNIWNKWHPITKGENNSMGWERKGLQKRKYLKWTCKNKQRFAGSIWAGEHQKELTNGHTCKGPISGTVCPQGFLRSRASVEREGLEWHVKELFLFFPQGNAD